jgi:predicted ArsR family transcriptional regulator
MHSRGGDVVAEFAAKRASDLDLSRELSDKDSLNEKVVKLSELLSVEGYAASIVEKENGIEICQHHCPIAHVAAEFPALCEAETESISQALGTHVQRLATIAHGDGVCTTFVPTRVSTKVGAQR